MIHPERTATGLMAPFCWMACGCGRDEGSAEAIACAVGALDAGNTPSTPRPVPWFAGCGGISTLFISALFNSALFNSALATIDPDVSGTAERAAGIALVTGGAGCAGSADASFIWPALTWTVLTRTGFIGSDEPGIAEIAWVWITPLVSGAGSGFGCAGGSAAVALAMIDGLVTGGAGRIGAASSGAADATCMAPRT